jgi:hypothetical protein
VIKVKKPVVRVRYDCPPELVERLKGLINSTLKQPGA